jgi:hypothetical protein
MIPDSFSGITNENVSHITPCPLEKGLNFYLEERLPFLIENLPPVTHRQFLRRSFEEIFLAKS